MSDFLESARKSKLQDTVRKIAEKLANDEGRRPTNKKTDSNNKIKIERRRE